MQDEVILVLGASGMLGNAVYRYFKTETRHKTIGTVRSMRSAVKFPADIRDGIIEGGDVDDFDSLAKIFDVHRPSVVINCVGLVKQLDDAKNPLAAIPINSILPHRLARLCSLVRARLVHMSTDCVFSGAKGMYVEDDLPDASDIYGRTKLLGEVYGPSALTLRTSIIGHELAGANSLICWFLAQQGVVRGFSKAVFSGLPTVEIARIIEGYVIPNPALSGLYHLSAEPIDKFNLLKMVANTYGKVIQIDKDETLVIDRSLDSTKFREATGFRSDPWTTLIEKMHAFG